MWLGLVPEDSTVFTLNANPAFILNYVFIFFGYTLFFCAWNLDLDTSSEDNHPRLQILLRFPKWPVGRADETPFCILRSKRPSKRKKNQMNEKVILMPIF